MKSIKCLLTIIAVALTNVTLSQNQRISAVANPTVDSVLEKLVAMAYENPALKMLEYSATQADYEYRRSKTAYLNNIVVSGNLNEFSLKGDDPAVDPLLQSTQYPRYNIGVILPLGLFINNGKTTKAAEARYNSSVEQLKLERRVIRRAVQIAYEDYLMNRDLLVLQRTILQDAMVIFSKEEEKFEKGQISIEAYAAASKVYSNEKEREINLIRDLRVAEAQLEHLIGMNINDALSMISAQSQ